MRRLREVPDETLFRHESATGMGPFATNGAAGCPDQGDCVEFGAGHLSPVSRLEEVADPVLQAEGISPEATPKNAISAGS
jgi:hypothetical protein